MDSKSTLTQLCAVITDDAQWGTTDLVSTQPGDLVKLAEKNGLTGLLLDKLTFAPGSPSPVFSLLKENALKEAQRALAQEQDMGLITGVLEREGFPFLLIKGAPLAYLYYPSPNLRPRADTDIFVPEGHIERTHVALIANGYSCEPLVTPLSRGQYLTTQFVCRRGTRSQATDIDIHWRINNSTTLGRLLTFAEIHDRSCNVARLGEHVFGPGLAHAVLISCLHWAAEPCRKLIWLYDLHLLNQHMGDDDWEALTDACSIKNCGAVVANTLENTSIWFNTSFPPRVLEKLNRDISRHPVGRLELLNPSRVDHMRNRYVDFLSLNWSERFHFLFTLCFPPATYVQLENPEVGVPSKFFLFWYYLRRPLRLLFSRH